MERMIRMIVAGCAGMLLALMTPPGHAEPYLAVSKGMHCSSCHTHAGGGGKRNVYGNAFSQAELAASRWGDAAAPLWTGELNRWFSVGGNLRGGYSYVDTPGSDAASEFTLNRATIYLEANIVPGHLTLYVDQQVAPSASINREAYVRVSGSKWFAAAGQFFLPYGLRLQDDTAFVRLATGTTFDNPDRGVQVGYESGPWSTIASVTNGSGGGRDVDSGKQFSMLTAFVKPGWRLGLSASVNNADAGDREMAGLFAGLKTGPIAWLAEVDVVSDEISPGITQDTVAGLVEANWMYRQGHNLKLTYEVLDPDDDVSASEDLEVRYSLVWEYSPLQFLQGRIGLRAYDGPPQRAAANRDVFFAELHGFF
jgi:hypothetical protein